MRHFVGARIAYLNKTDVVLLMIQRISQMKQRNA